MQVYFFQSALTYFFDKFVHDRFQIPHIVELYGSTEGTIGGINMYDQVGAIGYISRLFPILPMKVIKVDDDGNFRLNRILEIQWLHQKLINSDCLVVFPRNQNNGKAL